MKFIIHVGPHKTGTTYIQWRLDQNAAHLKQQGIYVPTEWRSSLENPSHTALLNLLNDGSCEELAQTFRAWSEREWHRVVISCEDLCTLNDTQLTTLRRALPAEDVTIVFYVRRWAELQYSVWYELTGHGATAGLLEYVAQTLDRPDRSTVVNIGIQVEPLIKAFGRANVKLVPYNLVIDSGNNLFGHFSNHFLGAPKVPQAATQRMNEARTPALLELVRILNYVDRELGNERSYRMGYLLQRRTDIDLTKTVEYLNRFQKTVVLRDEHRGVREVIEGNWTDYRDLSLMALPARRFYTSAARHIPYISPEYALAPGFAEVIRALREELLRTDQT